MCSPLKKKWLKNMSSAKNLHTHRSKCAKSVCRIFAAQRYENILVSIRWLFFYELCKIRKTVLNVCIFELMWKILFHIILKHMFGNLTIKHISNNGIKACSHILTNGLQVHHACRIKWDWQYSCKCRALDMNIITRI